MRTRIRWCKKARRSRRTRIGQECCVVSSVDSVDFVASVRSVGSMSGGVIWIDDDEWILYRALISC
jgi:hypothetical protein